MTTHIPTYHSIDTTRSHRPTKDQLASWLLSTSPNDCMFQEDNDSLFGRLVSSASEPRKSLVDHGLTEVAINREAIHDILAKREKRLVFTRLHECYPSYDSWHLTGVSDAIEGPFGVEDMDGFFESGYLEPSTLISNAGSDRDSFRPLTFWLRKYLIVHILQVKPRRISHCSKNSVTNYKVTLDDCQTLSSDRSVRIRKLEDERVYRVNELVFLKEVGQSAELEDERKVTTRARTLTILG
jgi:hypothetical protein